MKISEEMLQKAFDEINEENIRTIRDAYNKIQRWVIADFPKRSAHRYPNKKAVIFRDLEFNYKQLDELANAFANSLIEMGLKKYDRVAVLAHNTHHQVISWFGCCKAGAVMVPINYLLRGRDIAYCVNHSECKYFVVENDLYDLVKDDIDKMDVEFIWSMIGEKEPPEGFSEFDELLKSSKKEPDTTLNIEDVVQIQYTSGTETLPKAVMLTNQCLISQYVSCIVDGGYESKDIVLHALPLYHCAQQHVFLTPYIWLGATNILLYRADPEEMMKAVERFGVNSLFAPPTVWIGMLRHPNFDNYDLSSLEKCYYGASIMPVEVLKELLSRLPKAKFWNYYGQTELSPAHTTLKPEDQLTKPGSAGKGLLNMQTVLMDDKGNTIEQPGLPGEICGIGGHVMLGYFKDYEKTKEAFKYGWFHSGDIGVYDGDLYITVVDRKKDMIKSGGENVSSREVEEVIYKDSRVSEVAVIGLPHEKWIEAVTAIVVPKRGEKITEEEIIQLCRQNLAPFKVPKKVVFVEELPKTPTGKILKRELRKMYSNLYGG